MFSFFQDVRFGARLFVRNPGFAFLVVGILALGIGANTAVFSIVNAVLLRPMPYAEPERLFRIDEVSPHGNPEGISPSDLLAFAPRASSIEQAALVHWQNATLIGPEGPENTYGGRVSESCLAMLGARAAVGRVFVADEFRPGSPGAVLLSDQLWQTRFGRNPSVIGRTLMMSGKAQTVVGVMPREFFIDQRFAFWVPWQITAADTGDRRERATGIVRLKRGAKPAQAQAELAAILQQTSPEDVRNGWKLELSPVGKRLTERVRPALLVSLGAVGFVLLIACLNVANMLLARASDRRREIAIRASLGAGRFRIARQLLTESIIISAAGGVAGLAVGWAAAKGLLALFPEGLPVPRLDQTRMDITVLLFALGASLLTGLAFGIAPAIQACRTNLAEALKQGGRGSGAGTQGRRLRAFLVIAESALSVVLLAGAGLMLRSFDRLMRVHPGFEPDRVLTLRVPLPSAISNAQQQPVYYTRILERLATLPGLNSVGIIVPLPLADMDANGTFAVKGKPLPKDERQLVKLRSASEGYFRAMRVQLRKGRVFNAGDQKDAPRVAVVSETLVRRFFPNKDPIGQQITMSDDPNKGPFMTIVGVVNDVKFQELGGDPAAEMYCDYRQLFFAPFAITITLRAQSADPMPLAPAVQREIRALNPDQVISDIRTMRSVVFLNVAQPRFYTILLGVFAALALLLAGAGLYGVLAYSVSRRISEIGIRVALGAAPGSVLRIVISEALLLVGAGIGLGLAGSFALTRLIAAQLFQTNATDPATFAAVCAVLLAAAVVASYVPARRALKVDPAIALRCE